jgi:hypothetical protein
MVAVLGLPLVLMAPIALGVGSGLVCVWVWFERNGRPEVPVVVVVAALVAQVVRYPLDFDVPVGVFRPGPLRLPEILIITALVAKYWTRTSLRPMSTTGLVWLGFFGVYAVALVTGILRHNHNDVLLFHSKFFVYAGGCYLLAAAVPVRRIVEERVLGLLAAIVGPIAGLQLFVSLFGKLPGISFVSGIGPDTASYYLGFGLLVVLVELTRQPGRAWVYLAAVPLLAAPLVATQRGSYVHLFFTVALLLPISTGRRWANRVSVRPTQAMVVAVGALLLFGVMQFPGLSEGNVVPKKVSSVIQATFGGERRVESVDARLDKWRAGWTAFSGSPLLGVGLGYEHTWIQPIAARKAVVATGNTFDNFFLDLAGRGGIFALLTFGWAMSRSLRDGWAVWRDHADPRVAALGLACVTFMVGLLGKAIFETPSEKVVLACAMGLVLGMIASARSEIGTALAGPVNVHAGKA